MNTLLNKKKEPIDKLAAASGHSIGGEAFRRMLRSPVAITGGVITGLFFLLAIFAPLLAPKDPLDRAMQDQVQLGRGIIPGSMPGYPLGVDDFGRDFLSRLIVGAQQTLIVGVLATLIGVLLGVIIGGVAGAFGGWVDTVLMRLVDVMLSFPSLLLAISIAALFAKPSQWTVILAVSMVGVPIFARLLRGSMLAQRDADHVLAATSLGVKRGTIVFRHMLPNSLGPVIVQATLTLATAILEAAALSFLGLGDPDPSRAEWGLMLGKAARQFLDIRPELAYYPAIAIIVVALGFTLLGESLREALDPKNRR
ncbi:MULTISPECIES: ABC transporter permease [Amycolatopsis]|uniref:ABC transporter permease n=1 Tax=Amycolatopsis eburnea TaxID=2267691 RepID=A0A3R9FNM9_9PSEU|nr:MULTISPECIES: ABC transporter permease [Amycolatopsis]NBH08663.1 ABC transporter permease subunit [Amycolatopsis sp. SID8362]NED45357.1 ABC transporter permease [Amycolatopsis sp. SID8362]RSD19655.1 ABC transporter permease [Amycolatopsis eburnea]